MVALLILAAGDGPLDVARSRSQLAGYSSIINSSYQLFNVHFVQYNTTVVLVHSPKSKIALLHDCYTQQYDV